jgi:hypothetical protein
LIKRIAAPTVLRSLGRLPSSLDNPASLAEQSTAEMATRRMMLLVRYIIPRRYILIFDASMIDIVFGSEVPSGIQKSNIDISALKALGDAQMILLQKALHL